jgi:hypothetical protein
LRRLENAGGAPKPKLPRGTGTPPMLSKRAALSRTPATGVGLLPVEYVVESEFEFAPVGADEDEAAP